MSTDWYGAAILNFRSAWQPPSLPYRFRRRCLLVPCSKIHPRLNFCKDPIRFSKDISKIVEISTISQCWRILQKIPGSIFRSGWLLKFNPFFLIHRGATTAEKLRGTHVWVPTSRGRKTDGQGGSRRCCVSGRQGIPWTGTQGPFN